MQYFFVLSLFLGLPLVWAFQDFDLAPPEFDTDFSPLGHLSSDDPGSFPSEFPEGGIPPPVPEQEYPPDDSSAGAAVPAGPSACWINSYGRGVGTIPHCAPGLNMEAGLCYTSCPPDFKPVGPICWPNELSYGRGVGTIPRDCGDRVMEAGLCYERCPGGFNGVGPICWRGLEARGRGIGLVPNRCPSDRENQAGLCYVRCKGGFHGVGPVCWNDKKEVHRGVGTIPNSCGSNQMDAGLCYTKCKDGYKGIGPVCWQETCPKQFPTKCGALCVASDDSCKNTIADLAGKGVTSLMSDPLSAMLKSVDLIGSLFNWPKCD